MIPRAAIALLLTGCALDAAGKDQCARSADCDSGRVCNETGVCEPADADRALGDFTLVPELQLLTPRALASATRAGDWLYVIGGRTPAATGSIERAAIAADGTLSSFELVRSALNHARATHVSVLAGDQLCVIGGADDENRVPVTECAPVGTELGTFQDHGELALHPPRGYSGAVVLRPWLYLIGGYQPGQYLDNVERVQISAGGLVAPFQNAPHLVAPRVYGLALVADDTLYVLGGRVNVQPWSIESAPISAGGMLGGFQNVAAIPEDVPQRAMGLRVGRTFYLFGGETLHAAGVPPTFYGDRWSVRVHKDGALDSFLQESPLTVPRNGGAVVRLGDFVYVVGGQGFAADGGTDNDGDAATDEQNGLPLGSVERAELRKAAP